MNILFQKYQALGLDYIVVDAREARLSTVTQNMRAQWCERRFGIGAHGIVELCSTDDGRWTIHSYDSSGQASEFCAAALAIGFCYTRSLLERENRSKLAYQGKDIQGELISEHQRMAFVRLQIPSFFEIGRIGSGFEIKAQQSHFLIAEEDISGLDIHAWSEQMRTKHALHHVSSMALFERDRDACILRSLRANHATEDYADSLLAFASTQLIASSKQVFVRSRGGEFDVQYSEGSFQVQMMVNRVYEGQLSW